jgi:transcriptional regulator with XRE-family HTH domain
MTTKPSRPAREPDEVRSQLASFGKRLKKLRLQRGLTLQDLAAQSGLSKGFLSRLELGERQASISAVLKLCKIFQVSLASLFESPLQKPSCTIIRAAEVVEKSARGLKYALLSDATRLFNVQPIRVTVSPSRRGDEHYYHDGVEWLYVLRGTLTLSIMGKTYELGEGDAAHFESRLPHRLIARGGKDAEVLVVAVPDWSTKAGPDFSAPRSIPSPASTP